MAAKREKKKKKRRRKFYKFRGNRYPTKNKQGGNALRSLEPRQRSMDLPRLPFLNAETYPEPAEVCAKSSGQRNQPPHTTNNYVLRQSNNELGSPRTSDSAQNYFISSNREKNKLGAPGGREVGQKIIAITLELQKRFHFTESLDLQQRDGQNNYSTTRGAIYVRYRGGGEAIRRKELKPDAFDTQNPNRHRREDPNDHNNAPSPIVLTRANNK